MARGKMETLTEQMFYILLCLQEEGCGAEIKERVEKLTAGRVVIGPGTLYHLLEQFRSTGYIAESGGSGRQRSYRLTMRGDQALAAEYHRLELLREDYWKGRRGNAQEKQVEASPHRAMPVLRPHSR